jgi:hypothetical protein
MAEPDKTDIFGTNGSIYLLKVYKHDDKDYLYRYSKDKDKVLTRISLILNTFYQIQISDNLVIYFPKKTLT